MTAKSGKPVRSGPFLDLDEDDPAIHAALEIDDAPGTDPEEFADLLRDRAWPLLVTVVAMGVSE
jgi:hypothetical protein